MQNNYFIALFHGEWSYLRKTWTLGRASGFLIAAAMLLASCAAQATTYYVSSSTGSDSNAGTSQSAPWADTTPVNSAALQPGDQVLFKRGDIFRTPLWPTSDGASGNPITFADYGTGTKPTFYGSTVMNNASFVNTSGNVYTYQFPTTTTVSAVWVNKQFLIDIWANDESTVTRDPSTTPLCWKYNQTTGVLTISTAGGAPTGTWEAGTNYNMIENGNPNTYSLHNHLVFRNLISDESCQYGNFGYGIRTEDGTDITIDSCEAYRSGKHSFGCINSTQVVYTNCIGAYPAPNQGGYTTYVSYGDQAAMPLQTSSYTNCVSHDCQDTWQPGNFQYENFVDHTVSPVTLNITMNNMQAYSTSAGDGAFLTLDSTAATIKWTGGVCQGPMNTVGANPITIDGLNINGAWASLIVDSTGTVMQNCQLSGLYPAYRGQSTMIENDGANNTFRFNTIVINPAEGNGDSCFYNDNNGTNFYGNIIISTGDNLRSGGSYNYLDYDEYLSGTSFSDPHGLSVASPGFTNAAAGDYMPIVGSPSIDYVPSSIVSQTTPITTDFLGRTRPVNGNYDVGAYERQAVTAAHPAITSPLTATANYGNVFNYQIEGSNNPTSYGASGLPAGLSVNTSTGAISGVTDTTGTDNVTITATNSYGSGSATLVLTVTGIDSTPFTGTPYGANTEIDAPNFDYGGEGVAYNEWYGVGGNNTYRKDNANMEVTTTSDPDQIGGWTVTDPDGGEWVDYTINLPSASNYTFQLRTSSTQTSQLHIEIDGVNVTGTINLPNSGSLTTYQTTSTSAVALTAGLHVLRVAFEYYGFNFHWIKVNGGSGPAAPVITSATTATGTVGSAFSYQITATNSPTSFGASGLPAGTSVNTTTGLISGTPTTATIYGATVTATNSGGTGSEGVTMTINPAPPVVSSAGTASGTVGTAFSYQITASNNPTSYGATSLPAGTSVNTSTGLISGTPTTATVYNSTVSATNAGGTGSKGVTITINPSTPPAPVINSALTATGTVGTAFSYTITATNSPTSYNATPLPAGLSVATSTGVISGTPTTAGATNTTISATNSGGTGTATLVITINASGSGAIYQINCGGSAVSPFAADEFYTASGTGADSTGNTIATSGVINAAPMAVYQTERYGGDVIYTIPGLTNGTQYRLRLHFAETYWTTTGQRVFNILINNTTVQSNFDIIADCGSNNKADVKEYTATANSSGQIVLHLSKITDNAEIRGIEVLPNVPTYQINCGGAAVAPFAADNYYSNTGSGSDSTGTSISLTGATNPAPMAVYQSERYAGTIIYTMPNLTPGSTFNVRLHFAEIYWTAPGQREFNVLINNTQVLTNFDIIADCGSNYKADIKQFTATANSSGQIVIQFNKVVDNAKISGIEIIPD